MAVPMVTGDVAGVFQPSGAPAPPPFTVTAVSGSSRVRFAGSSVMLAGQNTCSSTSYGIGSLTGVSPVSTKVRVEGLPVLLGGSSVAFFGVYQGTNAVISASGATNISVS